MDDPRKVLFEKTVLERIGKAEDLTGHAFSDLRSMIDSLGGWQAATRLVSPATTGDLKIGFKVLAKAGLLRYSVEQAVIDFEEDGLFDEAEVSNARARIAMGRLLLESD